MPDSRASVASVSDLRSDRYAQLLADLQAAIALRVQGEAELAAAATVPDDATPYDLDAELQELARGVEQNVATADALRTERQATAQATFDAEIAAAHAQERTAVNQTNAQAAEDSEAVARKYDENCWMLTSIHDDESETSPKRQYESLKAQLGQSREQLAERWSDLKGRYDAAVAVLAQRRQSPGGAPAAPAAPRNRKDAIEHFDAADQSVRRQGARLEGQLLPRVFEGWALLALVLGLWGALFAVAFLAVPPEAIGLQNLTPVIHAAVSGGAALGVCVLILLILWGIASRRTVAAFEPLQTAMVHAQAYHQHWLGFAKEELRAAEQEYRNRYAAIATHRERALAKFAADRDAQLAETTSRQRADLALPPQRRAERVRAAGAQLQQQTLANDAEHAAVTGRLHTAFAQRQHEMTQADAQRTAGRTAHQRRVWDELSSRWNGSLQQAKATAAAVVQISQAAFPTWTDLAAGTVPPPQAIPAGVRIGDYVVDRNRLPDGIPHDPRLHSTDAKLRLPAVLPFPEDTSLVLEAGTAGRAEAVSVLQVAMLRLLTLIPPGKLRFTVADAVGLGEKFSAFMHLTDFDELLISTRIWTEASQIEQQLADLTTHMESVLQKYLRSEFETIEQYNIDAGEVAEPYRFLVVADFPAGFSERSAQRLVSIATSGPRCGVYTLVSVDTSRPLPHGFDLKMLEAAATVLKWQGDGFHNPALNAGRPETSAVVLRPDAPPAPPVMAAIVRRVGELSKNVRQVEVAFRRVAPQPDAVWTADSRKGVDCPLGRAGATRLQHMRLGSGTSQHVLLAGKTGSGKSTLLHVLITNLALRYAPDEVEFYLIDFKKGVEFRAYAAGGLPHARVIAIESDREFGVSVLERLDAVLKERGDLFRSVGVQDVAAFREARPGTPMPRIMFIVDEFQEFFTEDDKHAQTAGLLLDRLVRQGRAFGMHVLLGSQTLGGAYSLARTTIGQMGVRVALQCSEADAHLILSEENAAARLLTRPGEAIYNDAGGLSEGNSPFQIAWLGDDERDAAFEQLRDRAAAIGLPPATPIVFEGNVPADPAQNAALLARIAAGGVDDGDPAPAAWLGESVAITGPTQVVFRPQSGANLLIVGQETEAATGILSAALVALAAQQPSTVDEHAEPALAAFQLLTGDAGGARWQPLLDLLPQPVRQVDPDHAGAAVGELAAEVRRRNATSQPAAPPIFLLIDGLSKLRDLRRGDDDFGFGGFGAEKTVSPAKAFAELLKDGPAVGVHAIVWCDSYNNVDRWLGRALLREFEMRVVFPMSGGDSTHLIDSPAAGRLGPHRALLYLDERGTSSKFRPYGPPKPAWLAHLANVWQPAQPLPEPEESPLPEDLPPPDELDIENWVVL